MFFRYFKPHSLPVESMVTRHGRVDREAALKKTPKAQKIQEQKRIPRN
jgi:hypothetical protein